MFLKTMQSISRFCQGQVLIVGLGNPGKKYEKTRHNIGSRIVDELESLNLENITLSKPKSFMNDSGKAVKNLVDKSQIPNSKLIIIHDDTDLPLGKIRIVKNRGSAGHKGVESIIKELKTKDFMRFRVGIMNNRPEAKNTERFVLQKFNKTEEKITKEVIKKTAAAVGFFLKEGLEKTMQEYNK